MKFRDEERTRMVEVERGGKVQTVEEKYTVKVPVKPWDWDAIALSSVRVTTSLAVAGAVTWSTVAIGGLLSGVAPTWAAYLVAGVFDLTWITCMVLEWLSRYDRDRARLPIRAGWVALGMSVALISLDGHLSGALTLGVCGGLVSVMAKGMWTVVMRHSAVKMDDASQAWLDAERRETNAQLATVAARRQLNRTQHRTQAEVLALSAGQPDNWTTTPVQDSPVSVLDKTPETVGLSVDNGQHKDSGGRLGGTGSYPVRVQGSSVPFDDTGKVFSDMANRLSQRAFVRKLLSADPDLSDTDLSAALREEYGQDTKADSIRKAVQRARGDLSRTA